MAILRWIEHKIDVTPQTVRQGGFQVGASIRLVVTGKVTPARLDFYRELTSNRNLKEPIPVGPQGLA